MPSLMSFRSTVEPTDCDFLGHMNVSRYFRACSDAGFNIQAEIGLTASDMRDGRRLSFAVVHNESAFRAELHAGDIIWMESDILNIGTRSMTFRHRLIRGEDKVMAFQSIFKCALLSLEMRRAVAIPEDVRARAAALLAEDADG